VIVRTARISAAGAGRTSSQGNLRSKSGYASDRRDGSRDEAPRKINVPGVARDIQVKIASERSEWEQAFRLLAANYQARGYETPGAQPFRFSPHHILSETITLVAKHGDRVVATLSLVPDTMVLGLPMESIFSDEIDALRQQGRRLAEATCLADEGLTIPEFVRVFKALIKLGMQYHVSQGGDSWVISVNPRHRNFYQKVLGFVPVGSCREYPTVQGHPAEAFMLDVELMRMHAPEAYREVFGEAIPDHVLEAPTCSPDLIRFFSNRSSLTDRKQVEELFDIVENTGPVRRW
jgi:hypothetical protein